MLPVAALIRSVSGDVLQGLASTRACFLGLDISLSRTGLGLVDARGRAVRVLAASPPPAQRSSVLCSGAALSAAIQEVCSRHCVQATMVEDFLQTFEGGGSSSHTRFALARANGIGAYEAWRHTGAPVLWAYPTSMRAYFGVGKAAEAALAAPAPAPAGSSSSSSSSSTAAQHRGASRARAKSAVGGFVRWAHPALGSSLAEDEADALLAAMYGLAQEVEWRALHADGGAAFWGLLDAKLPSARLGKQGQGAHGLSQDALRAALALAHATALASEGAKRLAPGAAASSAAADAGAPLLLPARKRPRRSAKAGSAAPAAPMPNSEALARLYKRLRVAFGAEVRSALMEGPSALWPCAAPAPSAAPPGLLCAAVV